MPYLAFASLGFVWGTNFLFMKMAVSVLDPLQVVWLRVLFGSLPILAYALLRKSLNWRDVKSAHHFVVMAVLANVLPYYCFVKGTQHLKSGIAGVVSGTIPLMTMLFALFFLPEDRITPRKVFGIAAGFFGVALVAHHSGIAQASMDGETQGIAFMLLGSVSYASAMVYAKKFVAPLKMSSVQLAAYQTLCASLILTLSTPAQGIGAIWGSGTTLIALVFGLGLLGTGLALVMYYFIIEHLGAVTASSVYYVPPLVALLIGAVFLKEAITPIQACGTLLLLGGLYLAKGGQFRAAKKAT